MRPSSPESPTVRIPTVRACEPADIPAVTAIYAHYVLNSSGTFEETPPSLTEMADRRQRVLEEGMPWLVAELSGTVFGYACATIYRSRSAYRYSAEDSIYVHPDHARQGIGSLLLPALINACEKVGCRQMIAVIGDRDNRGSIRLHEHFGFRPAGELRAVGYKFGRWIDTIRMQRSLGPGEAMPPTKGLR